MPGSWLLVVEKDVPLAVEPAFSTADGAWRLARSGGEDAIDGSEKGRGELSGRPWVTAKCLRS